MEPRNLEEGVLQGSPEMKENTEPTPSAFGLGANRVDSDDRSARLYAPPQNKTPAYVPLVQCHPWYTDSHGIAFTLGKLLLFSLMKL